MSSPIPIAEQPERELYFGPAMQLQNDDQQAIEIAKWLEENGHVAWVYPQGKARTFFGTMLRIEGGDHSDFRGPRPALVFPTDWVLIDQNGKVRIIHDSDFAAKKYVRVT